MAAALAPAIRRGLADEGERVHAFTHLSHVYPTGSSLYTTFVFRLADDPDVTLARWRRLKALASEAIVRLGGTISHQHGVGTDHAPYLAAEKGELGMAALGDLARRFDPAGIMHPGVLPAGAVRGARSRRPMSPRAGPRSADRRRPPRTGLARPRLGAPGRRAVRRARRSAAGITGAGIARRAARAGLRTALVEKGDLAAGTSAWSSKLVHGGLRYLAHLQVGVVRESVRGREALLRAAPGLVEELGFLMPVARGSSPGPRR